MECTNEEEVFGDYKIEKFLEPCPVEKNQTQVAINCGQVVVCVVITKSSQSSVSKSWMKCPVIRVTNQSAASLTYFNSDRN